MYKICHVDLLQQTFEAFDQLVKDHFSLFPKPAEVIKEEEHVEIILDDILKELSDILRRKNMPQNEFEVFKISAYVLKLSQTKFPPSIKIRTKLLEILSLCYEYNSNNG